MWERVAVESYHGEKYVLWQDKDAEGRRIYAITIPRNGVAREPIIMPAMTEMTKEAAREHARWYITSWHQGV